MLNCSSGKGMKRALTLLLTFVLLFTGFSLVPQTADAESNINVPLKITTSDMTYPSTLEKGKSFSLRGTVSVNYGTITKITAVVKNRSTKHTAISVTSYPKKQKADIRQTINQKVSFSKLAAGSYNIKMTAYAKYGKKTTSRVIMNRNFTVKESKPGLTISGARAPSDMAQGSKAGIRGIIKTSKGKITNVWVYVINSEGKNAMSAKYTPNKTSFDLKYTANTALKFGALPKGTYTYKVVAKAVSGKTSQTKTLVETSFTVQ
ncbi:MAG: hypothetical protein IJ229_00820 [Clostridia bacterium]|nr:hypothetical protein [Clostridia bacterium]